MSEVKMSANWRTVQMFLSENGVYEVQLDINDNTNIKCDCKTYKPKSWCKHAKFVRTKMDGNDGHFQIFIPEEIEDDEAYAVMTDAVKFREFIIKHGKVEVI
jgi:hypothetical protein